MLFGILIHLFRFSDNEIRKSVKRENLVGLQLISLFANYPFKLMYKFICEPQYYYLILWMNKGNFIRNIMKKEALCLSCNLKTQEIFKLNTRMAQWLSRIAWTAILHLYSRFPTTVKLEVAKQLRASRLIYRSFGSWRAILI